MRARWKAAWSDDHAVVNPRRRPTNATCPAMSCFGNHLTCPLRIMFIGLNSLKRSPRRVKGSESLTGSDPPFDGSVILLDDIVQVADGSTATPPTEFAGLLQLCDDLRIGRVSIHIDHPRPGMARRTQCLLEEAFGRSRVRVWRSGGSRSSRLWNRPPDTNTSISRRREDTSRRSAMTRSSSAVPDDSGGSVPARTAAPSARS